ncbi:hypothetical protein N2152v2_001528 [Parachlorella kessleri]
MALLIQDAYTKLLEDSTIVVESLGSPDRRGLECIQHICTFPISARAFPLPSEVPFARVIVPLLRLITHQRFLRSPLSQFTTPVLAVVADSLRLKDVAACLDVVRENGGKVETAARVLQDAQARLLSKKEAWFWKPASWAEVALPIVDFLHALVTGFAAKRESRGPDIQRCMEALQALVESMSKQQGDMQLPEKDARRRLSDLQRELDFQAATTQKQLDLQRQRQEQKERLERRRQLFGLDTQPAAEEEEAGPGDCNPSGHRHDNDFGSIARISIAPTEAEVMSDARPYLPKNRPASVVHLPPGPAAHLDLHFRLMRHDILAALFQSTREFLQRLQDSPLRLLGPGTSARGGAGPAAGATVGPGGKLQLVRKGGPSDSRLWVYTGVTIVGLEVSRSAGPHFLVEFDDLPGGSYASQNHSQRLAFWEKTKRLAHGTLVTLLWLAPDGRSSQRMVFGTVSVRDARNLAPEQGRRSRVGVSLSTSPGGSGDGPARLLEELASRGKAYGSSSIVMLQASGSFFAYAPFLKALQSTQYLPLQQYLAAPVQQNPGRSKQVEPPAYLQGHQHFNLTCLAQPEGAAGSQSLSMAQREAHLWRLSSVDLLSPDSFPGDSLAALTSFDTSQIQALKAGLTQAVPLIQGPPGTGKTFLALKLVQVLVANQAAEGPTLVECLTNHALDQFLEGLVAMGIQGIVRVGSRSQSTVLGPLNLFEKTKGAQSRSQGFLLHGYYGEAEAVEEKLQKLLDRLRVFGNKDPPWSVIRDFMPNLAPDLYSSLVPGGVGEGVEKDVFRASLDQAALYKSWVQGKARPGEQPPRKAGEQGAKIDGGRFAVLDGSAKTAIEPEAPAARAAPQPPPTAAKRERSLSELLRETDAWSLTREERRRVVGFLVADAKAALLDEIQARMRRYQEVQQNLRRVHDEASTEVLRKAKVVGMTTAGVASQQGLITAVGFKIVVVEEAAEVLEAHILAGLGPQTEQLILIGDHKQLRPKIQTYELSMDSDRGYNLDLSLFERLVEQSDFPVVTLQQQHRMRPEISQLIRAPIYPALLDHARVKEYEHVKGMVHDVFFFTHTQPEVGDKEESNSKTNTFEAQFVARLALYLAQQGTRKGQITVLTAYVGQLLELRKALAGRVCVTLDDRDVEELADMDKDVELEGSKMSVGQAVRLATVDNFQGEESDIVILSLVRSNRANAIGFLKATNRANVALSRAKQGLYLVGNAECLMAAKSSGIWPHVVATLEEGGRIGPALPLVCQNHPDTGKWWQRQQGITVYSNEAGGVHAVTEVRHWEDFDRFVSDGGCSRRCTVRLPCGHACPKAQHPESIRCLERVQVLAPHCGHTVEIPCFKATLLKEQPWLCPHACGAQLACGHACRSTCGGCLESTLRALPGGKAHMEAKGMYSASAKPAEGAPAPVAVTVPLPAAYKHPGCRKGACLLPCGAPCARLPCDERCDRLLPCGHRCPAVCGEDCPPKRYCITCGSKDIVVEDVYLMEEKPITQLSEEEVTEDPLVVLPCGHAFFMSAMDQHMELEWTERSLPGSDELEKRGAYIKDNTGHWERPAPLAERMGAAKTCMKCRAPVGQLHRYSRLLNKLAADSAERKFAQAFNARMVTAERNLQDLQRHLSAARASALGANSTPADQEKRWRQLEKLSKQGKAVLREFQGMSGDARQPPTLKMYTAARMCVLQLAERSKVPSDQVEGLLGGLVAPHPDMTNLIKALIGKAQTSRELVQVLELEWAAGKTEHAAIMATGRRPPQMGPLGLAGLRLREEGNQGETPKLSPNRQAQMTALKTRAAGLERDLQQVLREGKRAVEEALELAEKHHNTRRQAQALQVAVELLLARASLADVKASSAVEQLLGADPSYTAKQRALKERCALYELSFEKSQAQAAGLSGVSFWVAEWTVNARFAFVQ